MPHGLERKVVYWTEYGRGFWNHFYLVVDESPETVLLVPLSTEYVQGDAYDGLEQPVIPTEDSAALIHARGTERARKERDESGKPCFVMENGRTLLLWAGAPLPCHEP
jgi:hypothetical protein